MVIHKPGNVQLVLLLISDRISQTNEGGEEDFTDMEEQDSEDSSKEDDDGEEEEESTREEPEEVEQGPLDNTSLLEMSNLESELLEESGLLEESELVDDGEVVEEDIVNELEERVEVGDERESEAEERKRDEEMKRKIARNGGTSQARSVQSSSPQSKVTITRAKPAVQRYNSVRYGTLLPHCPADQLHHEIRCNFYLSKKFLDR